MCYIFSCSFSRRGFILHVDFAIEYCLVVSNLKKKCHSSPYNINQSGGLYVQGFVSQFVMMLFTNSKLWVDI
jgi:hypothetical protein